MSTQIPQLLPIEINQEKKRQIILTNVIKMLTERKLMKKENLDQNIKAILEIQSEDETYDIKLENIDETYVVIILNQNITSITKHSIIGEYIYKDKDKHKIIIVNNINSRSRQNIQMNHPKIEIFLEKELMFNIVDCIYVPKHEVLSKEEADALIKEYNVTKRQLPYILVTDPMALYFNMQVGQICRITRPSETSGYIHYYRIVVHMVQQKK